MGFDRSELEERFRSLSDDELLRMVEEEADQYVPEAIEMARGELENRGLPFGAQSTGDGEPAGDETARESPHPGHRGLLCPGCGSRLRRAMLFGETQMVAVFEDNREQRFVSAQVCPRCGTADLFVDFETEVED